MPERLLTISEAAQFLGVSIDTLRRWDNSGKLTAVRKDGGVHRYYLEKDLELFKSDIFKMANDWALSGSDLSQDFYCSNSATFQARLIKMQDLMVNFQKTKQNFSLIVAVAGEIGNNSYDHNLGNWPDVPGIFFAYNISRGVVVLADRGLGVLQTLSRVRPDLANHRDAVKLAFTEIISGRAPEARGNGLKFVREVIAENEINLFFQSGDAELRIKSKSPDLGITRSQNNIRGCLALIEF